MNFSSLSFELVACGWGGLALMLAADIALRVRKRRANRREDMAAVDAICDSWKRADDRIRSPRTGRYRRVYAYFHIPNHDNQN